MTGPVRLCKGLNDTQNSGVRPHVCIITFAYPQPSETFIKNHVKALHARVVAEDILDKEMTYHVSAGFPFIRNASGTARIFQYMRRHWLGGERYECTPYARQQLGEILSAERPDVILVEFGHLAAAILPVLHSFHIPFLVHFHGMDLSICWQNKKYRRQLAELSESASFLIVVNRVVQAHRLEMIGCPREKIRCIPCGAIVESDESVKDQKDRDEKHILCVSRLTKKKGLPFTLKAFQSVVARDPEARLTIIGDGPESAKCVRFIKKHGLESCVRMLGTQPHDVVLKEMYRASIFAQHSITTRAGDEEGWPVSIAEAQGTGLPVVSTRSGGIPENVVDGVTGFLVDEKDWRSMADRLMILLRDNDLRNRMGEAARRHIMVNGNAKVQGEKLRQLVFSCVSAE